MTPQKTKKFDIVVGIPSFNNEKTIKHVLAAVTLGLVKYFPNFSSVIVNSDGGSSDKTSRVFRDYCLNHSDINSIILHDYHPVAKKLTKPKKEVVKYKGIPGKGSALRTVFEKALQYDAKVCIVVDSDLRSITPEWVQLLTAPILYQHFDYVTPLYARHKYDGTITNSIIYPLTRALYGKNIRQPMGGEFGISTKMFKNFLQKDVWETDIARFGIDIWMTTTAIAEEYQIAQVFLGAKLHDTKDPSESLGPMFSQVIKTLFELMEKYKKIWRAAKKEKTTTLFGFETEVEPAPVQVDEKQLTQKFREGIKIYRNFYKEIFTSGVFKKITRYELPVIRNIAKSELLEFSPLLWAECIYQMALFFHRNKGNSIRQEKTIEALVPLYFGFVAGFSNATKNVSSHESEILIEKIYEAFGKKKSYILKKWK